jgi:NAD-dependent dihydropyrimidine dehydrogenase PreA subunit
MSEQETYLRFLDWLRQDWFPLADADELAPLMKAAFSPEEASLLTGIPFSDTSLEELAEMKQVNSDELRQRLDYLTGKGAIFRTAKDNTGLYRLNDGEAMLTSHYFWYGRTDERTKAMAPLANQYIYHLYEVFKYTHHKGLRTLPIEGTIQDTRQILPYEEVTKVLDTKDYFCVATCTCRHRKNMDPDSAGCKYSTETCLHFDELAHYIVDNEMGREITREEARKILSQAAEEGLVHALSNVQEGSGSLCNCCQCCCNFLGAYHKLKHVEGLAPSNYRTRPNPELCIGCGLCVQRCPMNALHLEDSAENKGRITRVTDKTGKVKEFENKASKVVALKPECCIGCGVCAYKCATQSLVLERREVIRHPPKDGNEYVKLVTADFEAAGVKQKR